MDVAHHFSEALWFQAGGVVGTIHRAIEGQVPLYYAGAECRGYCGHSYAAFVPRVSYRHIEAAKLIHEPQIDVFKSSRVGAVAVQQGKFRTALFEKIYCELNLFHA